MQICSFYLGVWLRIKIQEMPMLRLLESNVFSIRSATVTTTAKSEHL